MKTSRKDLLKALEKVKPGLASSEVIEQSTSFVFQGGYITTYNDEVAASFPHPLAKEIEGAVLSNELLALLGKIKDEEIDVTAAKGELRIKGKKIKAGIAMEAEVNLPMLSFNPGEGFFELPAKFLEGLKVCIFSAAKESVSPVLSNIHMKGSFIESCDNFRLTRFDMGEDSEDDILVPAVACRYLINTEVKTYGEEDGWMYFQDDDGLILACRVYNDEYPVLDGFLEIDGAVDMKIPPELNEVLERSNIFASPSESSGDHDLVEVSIKDNWIHVRGENDHGWIEEKTRAKTEKSDLVFSLNPSIIREILKITDRAKITENQIRFEAADFTHVVTLEAKK